MTPGHGGTCSATSNSRYPATVSNSKLMRQRAQAYVASSGSA